MHPHPTSLETYKSTTNVDTIVFPTVFDYIPCLTAGLVTGAQCGHASDTGAHTGDISMQMLDIAGVSHVLCGHSERRQYHCETNTYIGGQAAAALKHGLHPIICIGETEKERDEGEGEQVIKDQLEIVLARTGDADITIAYEPVWAISGGDPTKAAASPQDVQSMHAFIRSLLPKNKKDSVRIIYGGSMKPENAEELLSQPDIDGGLVGSASLQPEKFQMIVEIAALMAS
jgi:triosephosphate isomerase (TIM)